MEADLKAPPPPQYGSPSYWDQRYTAQPVPFDWYQGYQGLAELLTQHIPTSSHVLHVGAGLSQLAADMVVRGGYTSVVSTDISPVAVSLGRETAAGVPGLAYELSDVTDCKEFDSESFDAVIDKGTLDALLCCGRGAYEAAARMTAQLHRVLRPGGTLMLITYGSPGARLQHLQLQGAPWAALQVYCLVKGSEASNGCAVTPVLPALIQGPFPASDEATMSALDGLEGVHYVYLATKPPDAPRLTQEEAAAAALQGMVLLPDPDAPPGSTITSTPAAAGAGGDEQQAAGADESAGEGDAVAGETAAAVEGGVSEPGNTPGAGAVPEAAEAAAVAEAAPPDDTVLTLEAVVDGSGGSHTHS